MKIQTLTKRLEKIGSKLESDNTFVLVSNRNQKPYQFKAQKNHDSDEIFAFSYTPKNAEHAEDSIIFNTIQEVTRHVFR